MPRLRLVSFCQLKIQNRNVVQLAFPGRDSRGPSPLGLCGTAGDGRCPRSGYVLRHQPSLSCRHAASISSFLSGRGANQPSIHSGLRFPAPLLPQIVAPYQGDLEDGYLAHNANQASASAWEALPHQLLAPAEVRSELATPPPSTQATTGAALLVRALCCTSLWPPPAPFSLRLCSPQRSALRPLW